MDDYTGPEGLQKYDHNIYTEYAEIKLLIPCICAEDQILEVYGHKPTVCPRCGRKYSITLGLEVCWADMEEFAPLSQEEISLDTNS